MKGPLHPAQPVGASRILSLGDGFGGIYAILELEKTLPRPLLSTYADLQIQGYFDLETRMLKPLDNPFEPRLSPM
jgi:hypothetical protein